MICQRKGCTHTATHYLKANAWALGHSPKTSPPLSIVIGLRFCRDCARSEAEAKTLCNDEFWQRVDAFVTAHGRLRADRASLRVVIMRGDPAQEMSAGRTEYH